MLGSHNANLRRSSKEGPEEANTVSAPINRQYRVQSQFSVAPAGIFIKDIFQIFSRKSNLYFEIIDSKSGNEVIFDFLFSNFFFYNF